MSAKPSLYQIQPGTTTGSLSAKRVWTQAGAGPLASGYDQIVPLEVKGKTYLIALNNAKKKTSVFSVQDTAPFIAPVTAPTNLGGPWDIVQPFVLANAPYLMAYVTKTGAFSFFPMNDDLSLQAPLQYARNHQPGITAGFNVVMPITIIGEAYYLCYSTASGTVAIYSLAVTTTSPAGTPPLVANYTWLHTWAKNWTRFAFFQLGGGNYFLKTNTGKLNVNIDHVLDDPTQGTIEVGTELQAQLPNALKLDIVRSFYLGNGNPYFLTYTRKDGTTTLNQIHGDCQGWDKQASLKTVAGATQIVPIQLGDTCFVLFC